jgi:menaquinone-dependent protoporphyrinogen oxidase
LGYLGAVGWLSSSGPLGSDLVDKDGRNVVESSRPREFDDFRKLLRPRGEQIFFGGCDPAAPPIGLGEKVVARMPAASAADRRRAGLRLARG